MSATGVEIIDLTDSVPQSPALPTTSVHTRYLRRQKRQRPNASSYKSPIVISESDNETAPSTPKISDAPMKQKSRKKRKKKPSQLEEGEIPPILNTSGNGRQNDAHLNGDDRSKHQTIAQHNVDGVASRNASSPPLFVLDDKPEPRSDSRLNNDDTCKPVGSTSPAKPDSLLLPDHVMLGSGPTRGAYISEEAAAIAESDTDDFILYADAELNVFARYYEEPKDDSERKAHLVCGQCGAEGDHKQADCPVVVCLTCGAHNEHTTRQCPIVKTCFGCGMKGHIREDCPNKHAPRRLADRGYDCTRCGSHLHTARECPTLWRMYEYVDDAEREAVLRSRRGKEDLPIGQGGEGYIGEDYWCYNCGGEGHLGDDCTLEPLQSDSKEPSAFGSSNIMSGPFAEYQHTQTTKRKLRREWEIDGNFDDGHGFAGPSDVGRRGRNKERERMRRQEKEMQGIDEDDFFDNLLQSNSRSQPLSRSSVRRATDNKKSNGFRNGDRSDRDKRRPADKLLDRISIEDRSQRHERTMRDSHDSGYHGSDRYSRRDRDRDSERDDRRMRDRGRERERDSSRREASNRADRKRDEGSSGRQYFGGYLR